MLAVPCACASAKKGASAPEATKSIDPLADAESRLAENASRLRALGIVLDEARQPAVVTPPPPPPKPDPKSEPEHARKAAGSTRDVPRCDELCELSEIACGLQERICSLADSHVGDPRYEDACWRARDQCDRSSDACNECSAG